MVPHGLVRGQVVERIDWTEQEFSLKVHAPVMPYRAGQFTKLALQNDDGEWIRRAYSIVNHPAHKRGYQEMEFLIISHPGGALSPLLHKLNVADDIYVGKEPAGFMTLDEIPDYAEDLWMLSSGTAIGPFLSMLGEPDLSFRTMVLVHAVRTEAELVYRQQIKHLQQHYAGRLKYVPIVSSEKVKGVLSGRIPALIQSGKLEQHAEIKLIQRSSFAYLCGNPSMVRDTSEKLKSFGLNKHLRRKQGQFSSENYW